MKFLFDHFHLVLMKNENNIEVRHKNIQTSIGRGSEVSATNGASIVAHPENILQVPKTLL